MSDAMYPTRLRWHHTIGVSRHDGVSVELHTAPSLPGMRNMTEMDYIPHVIAQCRIGCEAVRDMTEPEQINAMALLSCMSAAARDAMCDDSSVVVVIS